MRIIQWSPAQNLVQYNIDGLVQDCSNSSAIAIELLQSCTKPSTWYIYIVVLL